MSNKKKYIITAVTLGAIAACSGALIGVTNLVTRDRIAQNEKNKFNAGIVAIFGENSSVSDINDEFKEYKYITNAYVVNQNENNVGWAIKTSGSNAYGKISMIVGFNLEKTRVGTYMVVNEQSYASTLEDKYVVPLNEGTRDLDDVKCGATYGATLVKNMIDEAQNYVNGIVKEQYGKGKRLHKEELP